jgi:hypothetical protein
LPAKQKRYVSIEVAREKKWFESIESNLGGKFDWLFGQMVCDQCVLTQDNSLLIQVPEADYIRELQSKPRFFDHGFLIGFAQMLNHVHHQANNGINTIQAVHCMYGHRGRTTISRFQKRMCSP